MEFLYHYYEKAAGPFGAAAAKYMDEADTLISDARRENEVFAARQQEAVVLRRRELEAAVRRRFIEKGGKPVLQIPHYMVVGACPFLEAWFRDPASLRIHVSDLDAQCISFTYGDLIPVFREYIPQPREYHGQVYTMDEMNAVIRRYGLPQVWNDGGKLGAERYVQAQIWSDEPLMEIVGGMKEDWGAR